ncbi:MAG TPA: hypothetical protein VKB84_15180 [Candidatus Binataceae bacterium]|nr:hypothetical protein [Candidatus Binataceae bacterium]
MNKQRGLSGIRIRIQSAFRTALWIAGMLWLQAGIVIAILVSLNLVCWFFLSPIVHARRDDNPAVERAYPEIPWLREYYIIYNDGVRTQWRPYVHYMMQELKSSFINIDNKGIRATWNPRSGASSAVRPIRVFMFGGSTMFGDNARDDYTIPSFLSKYLAAQGMAMSVQVTNYGQEGYANTQEALLFEDEVRTGKVPDIVIFYDGANDVATAFENDAAGGIYDEDTFSQLDLLRPEHRFRLAGYSAYSLIRFTDAGIMASLLAEKLAPNWGWFERRGKCARSQSSSSTLDDERLTADVVRTYLFNVNAVEALAQRSGIRTLFFWQPVLFEKDRLSAFERSVEADEKRKCSGYAPFFIESYRKLRELDSQRRIVDLSRIFAGSAKSFYTDVAHLIEPGNEVVAKAMLPYVTHLLQDKEWLASRRNMNPYQPDR